MNFTRLPVVLAFCAVLFGALLGSQAGKSIHRAEHLAQSQIHGIGGWR